MSPSASPIRRWTADGPRRTSTAAPPPPSLRPGPCSGRSRRRCRVSRAAVRGVPVDECDAAGPASVGRLSRRLRASDDAVTDQSVLTRHALPAGFGSGVDGGPPPAAPGRVQTRLVPSRAPLIRACSSGSQARHRDRPWAVPLARGWTGASAPTRRSTARRGHARAGPQARTAGGELPPHRRAVGPHRPVLRGVPPPGTPRHRPPAEAQSLPGGGGSPTQGRRACQRWYTSFSSHPFSIFWEPYTNEPFAAAND